MISCKDDPKIKDEIANLDVSISIERFDLEFDTTGQKEFPELKQKYPFLFSASVPDSIYISRQADSLQKALRQEVREEFEDFPEAEDIKNFYKHLKYYFINSRIPRLITVTSDVDYRNKVIVTDSISLISLDTYLGPDHEFYQGIQKYISNTMKREMIVSDLAQAYAEEYISRSNSKTFLADLIYFGKILYFKDAMMPLTADHIKIGYSENELKWAEENEINIWRYFIENELIYSTDSKLASRFINPAPFSKFNLELDNESPGMLGRFIGWQMVRSYMENNDTSLQEMLRTNEEEIFKNSRYKPKE